MLQAMAVAEKEWQARLTAATQEATKQLESQALCLTASATIIANLEKAVGDAAAKADLTATHHAAEIKRLTLDAAAAAEVSGTHERAEAASCMGQLAADLAAAVKENDALASKHAEAAEQLDQARNAGTVARQLHTQAELSSSAELRRLRAELSEAARTAEHQAMLQEAAWEAEKQQLLAQISGMQQLQSSGSDVHVSGIGADSAMVLFRGESSEGASAEGRQGSAATSVLSGEAAAVPAAAFRSSPEVAILDLEPDAMQVNTFFTMSLMQSKHHRISFELFIRLHCLVVIPQLVTPNQLHLGACVRFCLIIKQSPLKFAWTPSSWCMTARAIAQQQLMARHQLVHGGYEAGGFLLSKCKRLSQLAAVKLLPSLREPRHGTMCRLRPCQTICFPGWRMSSQDSRRLS